MLNYNLCFSILVHVSPSMLLLAWRQNNFPDYASQDSWAERISAIGVNNCLGFVQEERLLCLDLPLVSYSKYSKNISWHYNLEKTYSLSSYLHFSLVILQRNKGEFPMKSSLITNVQLGLSPIIRVYIWLTCVVS